MTDHSTSVWYTRNMGILGVIIGAFIILHMGSVLVKIQGTRR